MTSLQNIMNTNLVKLSTPSTITKAWTFGSLSGLALTTQLVTGLALASSYIPLLPESFWLIFSLMTSSDSQTICRFVHINGVSFFFIFLYIHIGRGLYYSSFTKTHTWMSGTTMLLATMAAAFLGYVLPVTQMSFWGASVITNLFSEVPYLGPDLVKILWGGPSVSQPTIPRFYMLHFTIPFIIAALSGIHLFFLHGTGSSGSLGLKAPYIKFTPLHVAKDGTMFLAVFAALTYAESIYPEDTDNFNVANPAVTPIHIQPEWYFLFAYAILRSIPSKLGGVIALACAVLILYALPSISKTKSKITPFSLLTKMTFWAFIPIVLLLTWVGAQSLEEPMISLGQVLTILYFTFYLIRPQIMKKEMNF